MKKYHGENTKAIIIYISFVYPILDIGLYICFGFVNEDIFGLLLSKEINKHIHLTLSK